MSKTAHNDVTGESIKSGAGGKGNAADSQSKFDTGWDLLWGKTKRAEEALAESRAQWVAAVEAARKALPEGYVEAGPLVGVKE